MHPLLTDLRNLLRYLAAWLLIGAGLGALLALAGLATPFWALSFALPLCGVYAFVALSAYYLCRGMPVVRRTLALSMATFGGATLLVALGWLGLGLAWNSVGIAFGQGAGMVEMTRPAWVAFFAVGVGFYVVSILAHDVLLAFDSVRKAAAREAQAHGLARESELQLLRTQIHPHFLFNSLNSISALTSIDPAGAREMTIALAQFFRMTLALADRDRITLAEEVELCEHYLAIEKRRLGAKLLSALRIDPSTRRAAIPPLMLQPLIENAVKHGIRQLDEPGEVVLEALARDGWLHLRLVNPVPATAYAETGLEAGLGMGMKNIRTRLEALYGRRMRFSAQCTDTHFDVEITLPLELDPAA